MDEASGVKNSSSMYSGSMFFASGKRSRGGNGTKEPICRSGWCGLDRFRRDRRMRCRSVIRLIDRLGRH